MSPSWESRLEAARKARMDAAGESGSAASRDLPLPENVTWHRVSLVTPVLEGWKIVTGVLAFVTVQNLDDVVRAYRFIREHGFSLGDQIGYYLLGLVALIVAWAGLGLLSWWRRAYAVDADGVYLRSGILSRKLRTAPARSYPRPGAADRRGRRRPGLAGRHRVPHHPRAADPARPHPRPGRRTDRRARTRSGGQRRRGDRSGLRLHQY